MFTSRAEYRLLLREDNADLRLTEIGHKIGLANDAANLGLQEKKRAIVSLIEYLENHRVSPAPEVNSRLQSLGSSPLKSPAALSQLLRRPEFSMANLRELDPQLPILSQDVGAQAEIQIKYAGYVNRQLEIVERFQRMEHLRLPDDMNYAEISGLSHEVQEKLTRIKPRSLGQASRISGITPAALTLLSFYVKKRRSA
jgi:tRNA uridine 5-carboxymethylaminomethyl modification enzyme